METTCPSRTELNLCVFQRKPLDRLFFQPRFEPWFDLARRRGTLPEDLAGLTLFEFADSLGASLRYIDYYTGLPGPIIWESDFECRRLNETPTTHTLVVSTPYGDWVSGHEMNQDGMWYTVRYPVQSPDDFDKLDWVLDHTRFGFDAGRYESSSAAFGDRGVPQFWVPKSPYQALCQQWMTLDVLIYALSDDPRRVERTMERIDHAYDDLYEQICRFGKTPIVNFGENIHAHLLSPEYWERYFEPFYEKRCGQLKAKGIYTHIHVDGFFKRLLPYLARLPFDGIEALTPEPQGDVTLEEIHEHTGDKILLDLVPAILFLDTYSMGQFQDYVGKVAELFSERLVLGVSDEFPQGAESTSLPKLRWMAEFAHRYGRVGVG